jgi:hypothetical protein
MNKAITAIDVVRQDVDKGKLNFGILDVNAKVAGIYP